MGTSRLQRDFVFASQFFAVVETLLDGLLRREQIESAQAGYPHAFLTPKMSVTDDRRIANRPPCDHPRQKNAVDNGL